MGLLNNSTTAAPQNRVGLLAGTPTSRLSDEEVARIKAAGGTVIGPSQPKTLSQKIGGFFESLLPGVKPEEDPYPDLGLKIKVPFSRRVITRSNIGAEGLLSKPTVELPEYLFNTAKAAIDTRKQGYYLPPEAIAGNPKVSPYEPRVPNLFDIQYNRREQLKNQGLSDTAANVNATIFAGSLGILDAAGAGSILDSISKAVIKNVAVPDLEHEFAWNALGRPADITEAEANYRKIIQQVHPDVGGTDIQAARANNFIKILRRQGIPQSSSAIAQYLRDSAQRLRAPVGAPLYEEGLAPYAGEARALPGTRVQPGQAPAFGLSTRRIEPVGQEVSADARIAAIQKEVPGLIPASKLPILARQLERVNQSLAAAEANPEAHQKAYGEDKRPQYRAKIADLKSKINEGDILFRLQNLPEDITQAEKTLQDLQVQLDISSDVLDNNPAGKLARFVSKSGEFKGQLPEVGGSGKDRSIFEKSGDSMVTELGYSSSDEARNAYQSYVKSKENIATLREMIKESRFNLRDLRINQKDKNSLRTILDRTGRKTEIAIAKRDEEKVRQAELKKFDPDITSRNGGVIPPEVRGGMRAPDLDLTQWRDKPAATLSRETLERNIERIAPEADQKKLKEFIIDPIRTQETARVNFVNDMRAKIDTKFKELGINRRNLLKGENGNDDSLVQIYGEGKISLGDLQRATKNWKNVIEAANYTRKLYDDLLNKWNDERAKFDYTPVPKRKDYFRHFRDINQWTQDFGFLTSPSDLPTEISGITDNFKPGKSFTTAELRRTGHRTSYSAIAGMDNYLDSVSKQIYRIDSIQRGRALEKYIREAAAGTASMSDLPAEVASPYGSVKLPNFVANINETTNLIAGKAARADRAVESLLGRNVMRFQQALAKRFAANAIAGNLSSALTNAAPIASMLATTGKLAATKGILNNLSVPFKGADALFTIDGTKSSFMTRRFPIEKIQSNTFETLANTIGFVFKAVDEFGSRAVVAAKYFEGIENGLSKEEAMKRADDYAARVILDRSVGNLPIAMDTKTLKLFTQFQAEVNNSLSTLYHDIPNWNKGKPHRRIRILSQILQLFLYSYMFNELYKKVIGRRVLLDPIDVGLTVAGLNDEGQNQPLSERLKLGGRDLVGQLPFGNIFVDTGRFPLASALPDIQGVAAGDKSAVDEYVKKPIKYFLSPVGGGAQLDKTYRGIRDFIRGYSINAKKEKTYNIEKSVPNAVRSALFGPSAVPESEQYYNRQNAFYNSSDAAQGVKKEDKKRVQPTYDKAQKLVDEGKLAEARAIVDSLSDEDYAIYKKIKQSAKSKETLRQEMLMVDIVNQVQSLKDAGKLADAKAIVDKMTDEEYRIYGLTKTRLGY